jgi:hypothetical protein
MLVEGFACSRIGIDRCIQRCWPSGTPARLLMGHDLQLQAREVIACRQRSDLSLFGLTHDLAMGAHKVADRRVGENRLVVGLPAEQAGNRDEGQLLREQTSPHLEATGDDAIVRGKDSVARDYVGLRGRMRTDLAGEEQSAEATRDRDGFMPVSVDHLIRFRSLLATSISSAFQSWLLGDGRTAALGWRLSVESMTTPVLLP